MIASAFGPKIVASVRSSTTAQRALQRLRMLGEIEALVETGMSKSSAISTIVTVTGTGAATIWGWFAVVRGVGAYDRLAYLVPRSGGGGRRADLDEEIFDSIVQRYRSPARRSWAACVRQGQAEAASKQTVLPHARTLWRRLHYHYPAAEIAVRRGVLLPA